MQPFRQANQRKQSVDSDDNATPVLTSQRAWRKSTHIHTNIDDSVPKPSSTEGELHGGSPLPQPLSPPRPSENRPQHPPACLHQRWYGRSTIGQPKYQHPTGHAQCGRELSTPTCSPCHRWASHQISFPPNVDLDLGGLWGNS